MQENKIGHIYTAKISNNGNFLNLNIVYGDDKGNRLFICVPVKLAEFDGRPSAKRDGDTAIVSVKIAGRAKAEKPAQKDGMPF